MTPFVLTKIAPWPTGRMLALLYLVIGICMSPFFLLPNAPPATFGEQPYGQP